MTESLVKRTLELQYRQGLLNGNRAPGGEIPVFDFQDQQELDRNIEKLKTLEFNYLGLKNKYQDLDNHNTVLRNRITSRVLELHDLSKLYKAVLEDHRVMINDVANIGKIIKKYMKSEIKAETAIVKIMAIFEVKL